VSFEPRLRIAFALSAAAELVAADLAIAVRIHALETLLRAFRKLVSREHAVIVSIETLEHGVSIRRTLPAGVFLFLRHGEAGRAEPQNPDE
jgi:hypothetical protein